MRHGCITFSGKDVNFRFFSSSLSAEKHLFKHFLSPAEAWSDVEGVRCSDDERAAWRQRIESTGCAGEEHERNECLSFDDCCTLMNALFPEYLGAIVRGIKDASCSGQELYIEYLDDSRMLEMLSPYGITIIISRPAAGSNAFWTLRTAYMHQNPSSPQSETRVLDHLIGAIDSIYRKLRMIRFRHGSACIKLHTPERWQDMFASLDACKVTL